MFQSTPPAREATERVEDAAEAVTVSIHAPREGGDAVLPHDGVPKRRFNPRPPRGRRRQAGSQRNDQA